MAKKSSEVVAEPVKLAERLDPTFTEIRCSEVGKQDIIVRLRPLSYIQRVYCDTVKSRGAKVDREANSVDFDPESIAQYVQWYLRLGIESVEGAAWKPEAKLVAGRPVQVVAPEGLDVLPPALQDAIFGQVLALTDLSAGERQRLDFTSPSPEGIALSVMENSAPPAPTGL